MKQRGIVDTGTLVGSTKVMVETGTAGLEALAGRGNYWTGGFSRKRKLLDWRL
jgi:hypothetical protein